MNTKLNASHTENLEQFSTVNDYPTSGSWSFVNVLHGGIHESGFTDTVRRSPSEVVEQLGALVFKFLRQLQGGTNKEPGRVMNMKVVSETLHLW